MPSPEATKIATELRAEAARLEVVCAKCVDDKGKAAGAEAAFIQQQIDRDAAKIAQLYRDAETLEAQA